MIKQYIFKKSERILLQYEYNANKTANCDRNVSLVTTHKAFISYTHKNVYSFV